jgi:UDP-N-acetylmuramoylalanine--D-glutamate ligase
VTELTAYLLNSSGITAHLVGNIGTPCIELVSERQPGDYMVAELSSYQLHSIVDFKPEVAIILNITPDHLSWHGNYQNYIHDKLQIAKNLDTDDTLIIDASSPETRQAFLDLRKRNLNVVPLGTRDGINGNMVQNCGANAAAFINAQNKHLEIIIADKNYQLLAADSLQIQGPHNASNALAAAAAALSVGLEPDTISAALRRFEPLEHRFEPCGEVNGVKYINDSKATNTDAAIKALLAFAGETQCSASPNQVLALFGGRDKGTDLDGLATVAKAVCKVAVCYGEAGERFYQALESKIPSVKVDNFNQAINKAIDLSEPGDVVLLSPACSSFDEFTSFESRGLAFKKLVDVLAKESLIDSDLFKNSNGEQQ